MFRTREELTVVLVSGFGELCRLRVPVFLLCAINSCYVPPKYCNALAHYEKLALFCNAPLKYCNAPAHYEKMGAITKKRVPVTCKQVPETRNKNHC